MKYQLISKSQSGDGMLPDETIRKLELKNLINKKPRTL